MAGSFSTRHYSDSQEKRVAKAVGGRRTPNSGATTFVKGDVLSDDWCIECKVRTKPMDSFSIRRSWIDKNREEAFQMGKSHSALAIDFGDGEQHYLISERDFLNYLDYLKGEADG